MMNMSSEANIQPLLEQHLERQSLAACRSATFVQCLKDYGIAPTITVTSSDEKNSLSIRASDISSLKKRMIERVVDLEQCEYPLSTELPRIVELCQHYLLNEHTSRYRLLVSHTHRQWLQSVVTLVVIRYIMEQKYEHASVEGCHSFADPWVGSEMERLMILRSLPGMVAQLVHHVVKEPDQAQEMIEQFYTSIDIRMKGHVLVSFKHLQPLPQGTAFPLALPTYKENEEKEQDE